MRKRQQIWLGCLGWNRRQLVTHPVIKTWQPSRWLSNSSFRRFSTTFDKMVNLEVCMHFYRPQKQFREGNVFTGVCQSFTAGGGAVVPSYHTHLGLYPLEQYPQNHTPRTVPLGDRTHGTIPTPPGTTEAGGTHPTGMLSCCLSSPSRKERSRPFCTQTTARHHQIRMLMSSAGSRCYAPVKLLGNFTYVWNRSWGQEAHWPIWFRFTARILQGTSFSVVNILVRGWFHSQFTKIISLHSKNTKIVSSADLLFIVTCVDWIGIFSVFLFKKTLVSCLKRTNKRKSEVVFIASENKRENKNFLWCLPFFFIFFTFAPAFAWYE